MKKLLLLLFICVGYSSVQAQEVALDTIKGKVLDAANDKPLSDVNIINLSKVIGTNTNREGEFEVRANVNDTLYFSYLGFRPIQLIVTEDWVKYDDVKVKMTEVGFALEEVHLESVKLTGYLEIDAKNVPIYDDYRYQIAGTNQGYEAGSDKPGAFSNTLSAIFNPFDFLHNAFGKEGRQMRKIRKMKKDEEIQLLLEDKYNRETLSVLLGVSKNDINKILKHCNYSKKFIKEANDLQILDAISDCYENYRAVNKE